MSVAKSVSLTLAEFLKLPETKPASIYLPGEIIQKPMPKTRHSRLQAAFPELRCTFGGRSIVPDVAVIRWQQIDFDKSGEPVDDVLIAPNWTIEILSPDQSSNRVTSNILHCLKYGCQLGWLIDPDDRSVLVFKPDQQPEFYHREDTLPVLDGVDLELTVEQVFGWLKMKTD